MKKISAVLLSYILFISFACSENKSSTESNEELSGQAMQVTSDTPGVQTAIESQTQSSPEILQQSAPVQSVPVNNGEKLNPAHGQPGHDCAIAVGAPLNSAKSIGSPAIQPANQNPVTVPAQSSPTMTIPNNQTPAGTPGKVNPAHGEPGHDCAKPVGSPL